MVEKFFKLVMRNNKNIFTSLLFTIIIVSLIAALFFSQKTYKIGIFCKRSSYISGVCEISKFNWVEKTEIKVIPIKTIKKAEIKTDATKTLLNGGSVVKKNNSKNLVK